jgi:hypothetical protein
MRRTLGSVAFAGAVFAALHCEAIVSSDVPQFNCSGTSKSACPEGKYCKGSGCTACEKSDVCDHYDNDCNGIVDDGPLSDRDSDTYTECGEIDANGKTINVDCNDDDPTVHPNDPTNHPKAALAVEVCNGIDDDCNGIVDDPDKVCPPTYSCKPALQNKNPADNCIPPASDCNTTPSLCMKPQVCDAETGKCVSTTTSALGTPCATDRECQAGAFCGSPAYLGPVTSQSVCVKTCCTSQDCPTDFVCYAPGTDGRYCMKKTAVGITTLGTLAPGANTNDPTQCRSGQAEGGRCIDVCCTSANCTNGTACRDGTIGGKEALVCQPGSATGSGGACGGWACGGNSGACGEGVCEKLNNACSLCMAPCCGSGSCGGDLVGDYICRAYQGPNGFFTSCVATSSRRGGGATGSDCSADSDCVGLSCAAATSTHPHKYCTDDCCTDSDCQNGTHCRPVSGSNAYILHCIFN